MNYDLRFTARANTRAFETREIRAYFDWGPQWKSIAREAVYENEYTGVYLYVDFEPEAASPLRLSLNLYRPSIFALEAADVVEEIVGRFGFDVDDVLAGTGGQFDRAAFLASWNAANAAATRELADTEERFAYPAEALVRDWSWNRFAESCDGELEGSYLARIVYHNTSGPVRSFAMIPYAMPSIVPCLDDVLLARGRRSVLKRSAIMETSLISLDDLRPRCGPEETIRGYSCVRIAEPRLLFKKCFSANDEGSEPAIVDTGILVDEALLPAAIR